MRTSWFAVSAVALLVSGWLVAGGAVPAAEAAADGTGSVAGFAATEHFNDTVIGAVPAGWEVDTAGGTVAVKPLPDGVDKSMQIYKANAGGGNAFAERSLPTPISGTVHAEARVRVNETAGWYNVLYVAGSSGAPVASIAIRDGRFYNSGAGQVLTPVTAKRWYAMRVVLRTGVQRFDLFVDGARILADEPFRQASPDVRRLTFGLGADVAGTLHVDTVSLRREPDPTVGYHAFDVFDGATVGAVPTGYARITSAGTVGVAAVPSDADRSLLISNNGALTEATVERRFPAQTGIVTVMATVRTDETAGLKSALYAQSAGGRTAASLRFNNGELQYVSDSTAYPLVKPIRAREWYTIRLVLDVTAQQFVVYVDGRRFPAITTTGKPTRFAFRDAAATDIGRLVLGVGTGQTGTLRADKVMAYHNPRAAPAGPVVDVRDHGAVGDGVSDDTAALRSSIDAVPDGGTVLLSNGVFRSGTIDLKSRMTLWIAPDAMLLGTAEVGAYRSLRQVDADKPPFTGGMIGRSLIYAHRADDLTIEGGGVINGDGGNPVWTGAPAAHESLRPVGIYLARGHNATIRNIHVKNTGMTAVAPTEIDGVTIADVDIDNHPGPAFGNRDGIDMTDDDDVLVERVVVTSGDDAICFKSAPTNTSQVQPGSPSYGANGSVVRLSAATSVLANGVKFGTASHGLWHNAVVEDTLVKNTAIGGLVITEVDAGTVSNVTYRRITIDRVKRAIFVVLGRRVWTDESGVDHPALRPQWVSGLRYEDVTAGGIADGQPANHLGNGAAISGTTEADPVTGISTTYKVYDILFSNVRLDLAAGGVNPVIEPEEYNGLYPEASFWTNLDAYGYFLRHVDGLTMRAATASKPDTRVRPLRDLTRDVINVG